MNWMLVTLCGCGGNGTGVGEGEATGVGDGTAAAGVGDGVGDGTEVAVSGGLEHEQMETTQIAARIAFMGGFSSRRAAGGRSNLRMVQIVRAALGPGIEVGLADDIDQIEALACHKFRRGLIGKSFEDRGEILRTGKAQAFGDLRDV